MDRQAKSHQTFASWRAGNLDWEDEPYRKITALFSWRGCRIFGGDGGEGRELSLEIAMYIAIPVAC